jgi:hypothetical protein
MSISINDQSMTSINDQRSASASDDQHQQQ